MKFYTSSLSELITLFKKCFTIRHFFDSVDDYVTKKSRIGHLNQIQMLNLKHKKQLTKHNVANLKIVH